MTSKRIVSLKMAGMCGILAPIIAFICIGLAVLLSPWFSWTDNYLSDLGGSPGDRPIWAAHGIASILFNCGLVTAGALGVYLGLGLRISGIFSTSMGNIGTLVFILDACVLIGIGVFPETTGTLHTFFSIAFFILVGLALVFLGMGLIKSSEKNFFWLTIALLVFGLTSIPLFLTPKPWGSNAIAEMIPIVSIAIFSIVFGIRLFYMASMGEGEKGGGTGLRNRGQQGK
ncbi:MAG: DUF998 domain-containing protein [Methanomassiliicoccales archaeon]|nr:MAG: DUF998 domain-containing protein [Methanomassiliicoccales archaeon]